VTTGEIAKEGGEERWGNVRRRPPFSDAGEEDREKERGRGDSETEQGLD
jgi:hypothetical protein